MSLSVMAGASGNPLPRNDGENPSRKDGHGKWPLAKFEDDILLQRHMFSH